MSLQMQLITYPVFFGGRVIVSRDLMFRGSDVASNVPCQVALGAGGEGGEGEGAQISP